MGKSFGWTCLYICWIGIAGLSIYSVIVYPKKPKFVVAPIDQPQIHYKSLLALDKDQHELNFYQLDPQGDKYEISTPQGGWNCVPKSGDDRGRIAVDIHCSPKSTPKAVVIPKSTENCVSTGDNSPCITGVAGSVVIVNGKRIEP